MAPVLDRTVLEAFTLQWGERGQMLVVDIIRLFLADATENLKTLRTTLRQGAFDEAAFIFHRLKGGAAQVGGSRMRELCGSCEKLLRESDGEAVLRDLPKLEQELTSLYSALNGFARDVLARPASCSRLS